MSKRPINHKILPLILTLILCGVNFLPRQIAQATPALQHDPTKVSQGVLQALQRQETVRIIVSLVDPVAITAASSFRTQQVQQVSNSVVANLAANDFRPYRTYS